MGARQCVGASSPHIGFGPNDLALKAESLQSVSSSPALLRAFGTRGVRTHMQYLVDSFGIPPVSGGLVPALNPACPQELRPPLPRLSSTTTSTPNQEHPCLAMSPSSTSGSVCCCCGVSMFEGRLSDTSQTASLDSSSPTLPLPMAHNPPPFRFDPRLAGTQSCGQSRRRGVPLQDHVRDLVNEWLV